MLTPDEIAARVGKVTASRAHDIMLLKSGKQPASRANYALEKAVELVTGQPCEQFEGNYWTDRGSALESHAIAAYEAKTDAFVEYPSIVKHPSIDFLQATPDGTIDDGLIEVKCPKLLAHWKHWTGGVPPKYYTQIQVQLMCTEAEWCDFVSFHPDMPGNSQLYIERVVPDDEYMMRVEVEAMAFWGEVEELTAKMREIAA